MNEYPSDRSWYTFVVLTLLYFNVIVFAEYNQLATLSGDFADFLRNLESMVFKKTKEEEHVLFTTEENLTNRNDNVMSKGQKSTLRDALMMKLVSYYENKYKLFHLDTTTRSSTETNSEASSNKRRYNEVELIDENPIFDSFARKATSSSVAEVVVV